MLSLSFGVGGGVCTSLAFPRVRPSFSSTSSCVRALQADGGDTSGAGCFSTKARNGTAWGSEVVLILFEGTLLNVTLLASTGQDTARVICSLDPGAEDNMAAAEP